MSEEKDLLNSSKSEAGQLLYPSDKPIRMLHSVSACF